MWITWDTESHRDDWRRVEAKDTLEGFPFPTTQTQVRSFLGMCKANRRLVKDFAKIAGPLKDLLEQGTPADQILNKVNQKEV